MSLDVASITNTMISGVRHAIGDRWATIRALAEPELRKLAQTLEDVHQLYADKEITADHAAQLVEMQRNTAMSVLLGVEGLGALAARDALDAAAHAAGSVVNQLVGFKLISANEGEDMPDKEQEIARKTTGKPISQESAKSSPTGRTKETTQARPVSPAKPASRPVKAKFKAGKDL
jgi:hypothetical protein